MRAGSGQANPRVALTLKSAPAKPGTLRGLNCSLLLLLCRACGYAMLLEDAPLSTRECLAHEWITHELNINAWVIKHTLSARLARQKDVRACVSGCVRL